MVGLCAKCFYITPVLNKSLYGDYLCDECWYDYLCTDRGKVEYFVGLAMGDYPVQEFDADFLGEVITQWYRHKHLLRIPEELINIYEMLIFELFEGEKLSKSFEEHTLVMDTLRMMAKEIK